MRCRIEEAHITPAVHRPAEQKAKAVPNSSDPEENGRKESASGAIQMPARTFAEVVEEAGAVVVERSEDAKVVEDVPERASEEEEEDDDDAENDEDEEEEEVIPLSQMIDALDLGL